MFSLMGLILVTPIFDMNIATPTTALGNELVSAMEEVGSPIGEAYINPILVDAVPGLEIQGGQLIEFEWAAGKETALQRFGLIDSNMVKNFRNRLTAAALFIWDKSLGSDAVVIEQVPWLAHDIPYSVYFGMAMLPLAATLAAVLIGAFLSAQEFEFNTIIEYRLSPISIILISGARLLRLSLTGLISGLVLMLVVGLITGVWPASPGWVVLILLAMALIGGCIGTLAGLVLQKTLPAFLIGLALTFVAWLLGSAFGLAAGFSGPYEAVSRFMPNTYAVELLFPLYYRVDIGSKLPAILILSTTCVILILATLITYRKKVIKNYR
jgi:ABC-type multidrug transport system permease subunit